MFGDGGKSLSLSELHGVTTKKITFIATGLITPNSALVLDFISSGV
jgi:hypothetical protein